MILPKATRLIVQNISNAEMKVPSFPHNPGLKWNQANGEFIPQHSYYSFKRNLLEHTNGVDRDPQKKAQAWQGNL